MQRLRNVNLETVMFWLPLLLYVIDFYGLANYIVIVWIFFAIAFCGVSLSGRINVEGAILITFSVLYFLFYLVNNPFLSQVFIRYLLAPWLCYFIAREYCNSPQRVTTFILVVICTLFLYASLTMILSLSENYKIGALTTIWNNKMSTTLFGILLAPMASVFYVGLKYRRKKAYFLLSLTSIIAMHFTVITGRRTLLVVFVILLGFNIILDIITSSHKSKIIITVAMVGTVLVVGYSFDFLGARSYIESSLLYERLVLGSQDQLSGRSDVQVAALMSLGDKLMGSDAALETSYAHNLWLDAFMIGGIFPFTALVAYSLSTIKTLCYAVRKYGLDDFVVRLYMCVFLGLNLAFFVEPVLQGAPHIFILLCAMNGAMSTYAYRLDYSEVYRVCDRTGDCKNANSNH